MTRPIKLLLLIPHLGGGGAERVMAQVAEHLDPQRFEVHLGLITQDSPGAQALPESVQIHRLSCKQVRWAGPALIRLVRELRPEIVLSGMAHLNFLVLLLKPLLPRRTCILVRQNTTASQAAATWLGRLPYRYLYPRAAKIICQSGAMADDLAGRFAIARSKLVVLANPVNLPGRLAGGEDDGCVWPAEAWPRFLMVGRLSPEKGADLLLRAMPSILARFPHACAQVLGTGPEEGPLRRLAEGLRVERSVIFCGYRTNVEAFYAGATLFVQPSRYEGMPNAMLEAAAAGLPIVATPCSEGVCELLRGVEGAWLASAVDYDSLAEAVLVALAELSQHGAAQRRYDFGFIKNFATEVAVAGYASLFESVAAPRQPVHIAMMLPTIDRIGGAERQVIDLSEAMAARGYRVTVVALSGSGMDAGGRLSEAGVAFVSLGMRKAWIDPRGWLRYLSWARDNRPEVVHTHLPHATWFARWARLLAPVRVQIDTVHTSRTGGPFWRLGYRVTSRMTNLVTCVSSAVADATAAAGLAFRENLTIIPNGVPVGSCRVGREVDPGGAARRGDSFRWIAVGRLAQVKDYPTLLRGFAGLAGNSTLEIVGEGPEEHRLRALAVELGVGNRVQFAGFRRDVQALLLGADGFVLTSLWEGLPLGVLEAGAVGLPVVATDGPGTREAIVPGRTGVLVPVGDVAALTSAMASVMSMGAAERVAMGQRGRKFVEEHFSMGVIVDRWLEVYSKCLQSRPRPARWS